MSVDTDQNSTGQGPKKEAWETPVLMRLDFGNAEGGVPAGDEPVLLLFDIDNDQAS